MTARELIVALLDMGTASLDYDVVHNGLIVGDIAVRDDDRTVELVPE